MCEAFNNISMSTFDGFFVREERGLNLRSQPDLSIPSMAT